MIAFNYSMIVIVVILHGRIYAPLSDAYSKSC